MLNAFLNIFKIPELRNKVLFTLSMLVVFRVGHWIPLPGVNIEELSKQFEQATQSSESAFARAAQFVSMMSGGSFTHSTIFGLGVMPYITASIIFQLLGSVLPQLKKIQEDGPSGRQKIMSWTRYATLGLCVVQGFGWLKYIQTQGLIYPSWAANPVWWVMAILCLTAGCMFLMWIGEQIDKYGIGNGVSMIIMTGILAQMPTAVQTVISNYSPGESGKIGPPGVAFLVIGFILVVAGSVVLTVAQRRIPLQMAKHSRGRTVVGGERSYLPLKVNHSGVMPVVFASSLMIFPAILFQMFGSAIPTEATGFIGGVRNVMNYLHDQLGPGQYLYLVGEVIMIYFFAYFWITVQFNPEDISKQMRDSGSFITGLRPGPRTAEYLEAVISRITYVGAAFLAFIAVLPMLVSTYFGIPPVAASFLGGTGLLIVVSVVLDFIQRVEANLLMRNYAGFLGEQTSSEPRLRSTSRMAMDQP